MVLSHRFFLSSHIPPCGFGRGYAPPSPPLRFAAGSQKRSYAVIILPLHCIKLYVKIILVMATMNLLQAKVDGKLGEMYGAKWKNKPCLKAVPFSHAPHNTSQKQAFSAFGCLNRVASGIANTFWNYLGLSDRVMLRHNAVANWLKVCVSNRTFDITKAESVIPADGTVAIGGLSLNFDTNIIEISASTSLPVQPLKGQAWFVGIFDSNGKKVAGFIPSGQEFSYRLYSELNQKLGYFAIAFRSDKTDGKIKVHGFSSVSTGVWVGSRLNLSAMSNPLDFYFEDVALVAVAPRGSYVANNFVIQ